MKKVRMTEGSLAKNMLLFSLPLVLSNLLQVLFNIADVAVVGRFAGTYALGAVGSTTTLVTLFTGFLIGTAGGINVLVALYYGAREDKALSETIHTAAIFSVALGLIIMAIGMFLSPNILIILKTKEELIGDAVLYMRVYSIGMPALAIYNYGNAVLSAIGDTKRPLIFLSIAGLMNVILNLTFVVGFKMGVEGVAIASVISQYISAVLIIITMLEAKEKYALRINKLKVNVEKLKSLIRVGIPAGLQCGIFQIANLFIQYGVNSFDAITVAGNAAAQNADPLVYDVMAAFYTAGASFIGQNLGARKKDRIRNAYIISVLYAFIAGLIMGVALYLVGPSFLHLFAKDDMVVLAGMRRLQIMSLSYCISALMDASIAASRGLGKTVVPTFIVIMGSCVFRIIWVFTIFTFYKTIGSLYLLYVFSWTITGVAAMIYFIISYRQRTATM